MTDRADVGAARRFAVERIGSFRAESAAAALVVTELGTNLVKHAGGGALCMGPSFDGLAWEVLAVDDGPGMRDVDRCLGDRYSTAQTSGTGLGAVLRHTSGVELASNARGTVIYARIGGPAGVRPVAVQLAHPKEAVSGDAWVAQLGRGRVRVALVDALGHGPRARIAAAAACAAVAASPLGHSSGAVLDLVHRTCQEDGLRGVVGTVVDLYPDAIEIASVGTVSAVVARSEGHRERLPTRAGILGRTPPRIEVVRRAMAPGDIVLLASDGFTATLAGALARGQDRHPALLVGRLCQEAWRSTDDATGLALPQSWVAQAVDDPSLF